MFWKTVKEDYLLHRKTQNYLGFLALFNYRMGCYGAETRVRPWGWLLCKLHALGMPFCEGFCGVHLGRRTKVGANLHLIHSGGINIHDRAVLGDRVGIMQNVTIGQNVGDGVPVIGDDVFIGACASVLGGITVGNKARIAANSLVISDVPPGHLAIGVPAKTVPNLFAVPNVSAEGKAKQQAAAE
jgi:serine O-acetyltransferase